MKFTLWLFRDWFEKKGISNSYKITNTFDLIDSISFHHSHNGSGIAAISSNVNRSHSEAFYRCKLSYKNDEILFPVTSQESVYNLCLDMMTFYNDWENTIQNLIINDASASELLNIFSQAFPHPLAVLYQNAEQNCYSSDWKIRLSKNTLNKIPESIKPDTNEGPVFLSADFFGVDNAIIKSITAGRNTSIYLAAYDESHSFKTGELHIFNVICQLITQSIQFQQQMHQHIHPLATWYRQQLEQNVQMPVNMQTLLNLGWKNTDSYQILSIQTNQPATANLRQFQELLTEYNYCCVSMPEGLSVLLHFTPQHSSTQMDTHSFLSKLCSSRNVFAGFSLSFNGLDSLFPYYRQSLRSAALSKTTHTSYIFAQNYLTDFIRDACSSIHDVRAYIHPDVSTLGQLDTSEGEDLVHTLYTYLFLGKSCVRTAEELQIHRNTLRTRLARINEILPLDSLNEMELEHIMLSLLFTNT